MFEKLFEGLRRTCWRMEELPDVPSGVGIWGAGTKGRKLQRALLERNIVTDFFVDNDLMLQGESINGAEVIPLEFLGRQAPRPIFITPNLGYDMAMRLRRLGFEEFYHINDGYWRPTFPMLEHEKELEHVYELLADAESRTSYAAIIQAWATGQSDFVHPAAYPQNKHPRVKALPGDIIVNGGGYVGNVASNFARLTNRSCQVYSFEPSPVLSAEMWRNIEARGLQDLVIPVNMLLWKERGFVPFSMETPFSGNSRAATNATTYVPAIDLDTFVLERKLQRVDLIELDVEGSEMDVLNGAAATIARFKPRLQISLYHASEHLWQIPLYLHNLVPQYTFYIGHHTLNFNETMLYAIV